MSAVTEQETLAQRARSGEYDHLIVTAPGDGVGPDVVAAARRVLDALGQIAEIAVADDLLGAAAIDVHEGRGFILAIVDPDGALHCSVAPVFGGERRRHRIALAIEQRLGGHAGPGRTYGGHVIVGRPQLHLLLCRERRFLRRIEHEVESLLCRVHGRAAERDLDLGVCEC